jgi:hypothetical protein
LIIVISGSRVAAAAHSSAAALFELFATAARAGSVAGGFAGSRRKLRPQALVFEFGLRRPGGDSPELNQILSRDKDLIPAPE